jgi:hypothetical protein
MVDPIGNLGLGADAVRMAARDLVPRNGRRDGYTVRDRVAMFVGHYDRSSSTKLGAYGSYVCGELLGETTSDGQSRKTIPPVMPSPFIRVVRSDYHSPEVSDRRILRGNSSGQDRQV